MADIEYAPEDMQFDYTDDSDVEYAPSGMDFSAGTGAELTAGAPDQGLFQKALSYLGIDKPPLPESEKARSLVELQARQEGTPLQDYQEGPQALQQFTGGLFDTMGMGVPGLLTESLENREFTPAPAGAGQSVARGLGDTAGFMAQLVGGPAGILSNSVGNALVRGPAEVLVAGLANQVQGGGGVSAAAKALHALLTMGKEATSLGILGGLSSVAPAMRRTTIGDAAADVGIGAASGALTGALFGGVNEIPSRIGQIATALAAQEGTAALLGLEGPITGDQPIEDKVREIATTIAFLSMRRPTLLQKLQKALDDMPFQKTMPPGKPSKARLLLEEAKQSVAREDGSPTAPGSPGGEGRPQLPPGQGFDMRDQPDFPVVPSSAMPMPEMGPSETPGSVILKDPMEIRRGPQAMLPGGTPMPLPPGQGFQMQDAPNFPVGPPVQQGAQPPPMMAPGNVPTGEPGIPRGIGMETPAITGRDSIRLPYDPINAINNAVDLAADQLLGRVAPPSAGAPPAGAAPGPAAIPAGGPPQGGPPQGGQPLPEQPAPPDPLETARQELGLADDMTMMPEKETPAPVEPKPEPPAPIEMYDLSLDEGATRISLPGEPKPEPKGWREKIAAKNAITIEHPGKEPITLKKGDKAVQIVNGEPRDVTVKTINKARDRINGAPAKTFHPAGTKAPEPAVVPRGTTPEAPGGEDITIKGKAEKTVSVDMTKAKEKALTPTQQKKYLMAEIDAAMETAKDQEEFPEITKDKGYASAAQMKKDWEGAKGIFKKYGTVKFEVPGDGTFTVLNTKTALEKFKKMAGKITSKAPKRRSPLAPPTGRRTGKRIVSGKEPSESVSYFHPYKPQKEKEIIEHPERPASSRYDATEKFYSEGGYAIRSEKKPSTKGYLVPADGMTTNMLKEIKSAKPAEIVGVFPVSSQQTEPGFKSLVLARQKGADWEKGSVFNAAYIDAIMTRYPKAKPHMTKRQGADILVFKEGRKVVGFVSPLSEKPEDILPRHLPGKTIASIHESESVWGKSARGEIGQGSSPLEPSVTSQSVGSSPSTTKYSVSDVSADVNTNMVGELKDVKWEVNVNSRKGKKAVRVYTISFAPSELASLKDGKTDVEITDMDVARHINTNQTRIDDWQKIYADAAPIKKWKEAKKSVAKNGKMMHIPIFALTKGCQRALTTIERVANGVLPSETRVEACYGDECWTNLQVNSLFNNFENMDTKDLQIARPEDIKTWLSSKVAVRNLNKAPFIRMGQMGDDSHALASGAALAWLERLKEVGVKPKTVFISAGYAPVTMDQYQALAPYRDMFEVHFSNSGWFHKNEIMLRLAEYKAAKDAGLNASIRLVTNRDNISGIQMENEGFMRDQMAKMGVPQDDILETPLHDDKLRGQKGVQSRSRATGDFKYVCCETGKCLSCGAQCMVKADGHGSVSTSQQFHPPYGYEPLKGVKEQNAPFEQKIPADPIDQSLPVPKYYAESLAKRGTETKEQIDMFDMMATEEKPKAGTTTKRWLTDKGNVRHTTTGYLGTSKNMKKIKGPGDAASFVAPFRKHAQENVLLLGVDKQGRPIELHRYSKGLTGASQLDAVQMAGTMASMKGIHSAYFIHNHPSGTTAPSEPDNASAQLISAVASLSGIKMNNLILAGTEYVSFSPVAVIGKGKITPVLRDYEFPVKERIRMAGGSGPIVNNNMLAITFLKEHDLYRKEGFIFLDSKLKVSGVSLYEPGTRTPKTLSAEVVKTLAKTNATMVLPFFKDTIRMQKRFDLLNAINNTAIVVSAGNARFTPDILYSDKSNGGGFPLTVPSPTMGNESRLQAVKDINKAHVTLYSGPGAIKARHVGGAATGAMIGFAVGGPPGAAVGASIGAGLEFVGTPLWDGLIMKTVPDALEKVPVIGKGVKTLRRVFDPSYRGDLADKDDYLRDWKVQKLKEEKAHRYAIDLGKRLSSIPEDAQMRVGEAIRGELDPETLSSKERLLAKEATNIMTFLGKQFADLGFISQETFFKNVGRYMPRLYTSKEYKSLLNKYGLSKPNRLDISRAQRRKDIPKEVREEMGEILTPGYPIAKGIMQLSHDIELAKTFNKIATNPDWAFTPDPEQDVIDQVKEMRDGIRRSYPNTDIQDIADALDMQFPDLRISVKKTKSGRRQLVIKTAGQAPANFVQLPINKKLGRLSGAFVHPEIEADINFSVRTPTEVERQWVKYLSWWKAGKVIWSPKTYMRNFRTNALLAHMGGLPLYKQPSYLVASAKDMKSTGPYVREATEWGLKRGTYASAELRLLYDTVDKELGKIRDGDVEGTMDAIMTLPSRVANAIGKTNDKLGKAYGLVEEWHKLAMFIYGRKNLGMTPEMAMDWANKWLFDYQDITRAQRVFRQSPMGAPFGTFTLKAIPRVFETMIKTPHRMFLPLAFIYGLGALTSYIIGDTKDQEEAKEKLRPDWARGSFLGIPNFQRVPVTDQYGREYTWNLTYDTPWGAIAEGGGSFGIPGGIMPISQPFISEFIQQSANYDFFWEENIVKEEDTAGLDTMGKIMRETKIRGSHMLMAMAPTPVVDANKILAAYKNVPDYKGRYRSKGVVLADVLLGVKLYPVDYTERFQRIYNKYQPGSGSLSRKLFSKLKTNYYKRAVMQKNGQNTDEIDSRIDELQAQLAGIGIEASKWLDTYARAMGHAKKKPDKVMGTKTNFMDSIRQRIKERSQ